MPSTTPLRLDELAAAATLAPPRLALLRSALAAGLPTARDENWRYANLRALDRQVFTPAEPLDAVALRAAAAALPPPLEGHARLVVVDGWLAESLSVSPLPTGVTRVDGSGVEQAAAPGASAPTPATPFRAAAHGGAVSVDLRLAQLNAALAPQALCIELPPGDEATLEVVFVATADGARAASHPAIRVRLGDAARLTLVERHLGAGDAATFTNADVRVEAGRGAHLRHTRLQLFGPRARHFETLTLQAQEGAECEFVVLAAGAQSARSTALLSLEGRDATLRWNAVSLGDRAQVNDAFVRVDHVARGARTQQAFRGIAAGRSRVAFNGHMVVREGAVGASSDQSLKALLAGAEAEADVRPQLEIYVDEVRASHGATVGKLDEQMRFYLLSRGIDRDTAEALLKWAFVEDVVSNISSQDLRRQVESAMAAQLRAIVDAGELR